ncbi:MAG TPA: GTPase Era [Candidatus Cloacimonetes bacterium]|nr:GTPase Era [Candidatus Cloacimonadota bacterium]
MDKNFRSGFVSIVGKPNVGKSTLINKFLKEKLSIITPKPQTTRQQIKGIFNDEDKQIIFLDTPGYLKPRYELQEKMLEYIKRALSDSDLIIFMTDAKNYPSDYDEQLLAMLQKIRIPKIAILNKIDLVTQELIDNKHEILKKQNFDETIPISLKNTADIEPLLDLITGYLPFNPPFYGQDELTDLSEKFFVQEIIREQIFLNYQQEIPYASTVVVEQFKELPNRIEISANIWLERKSQKPILIGKNGTNIKALRIASEKEIYKILGKRIKLDLWIKIKPNWRKKKNALKEFGYR